MDANKTSANLALRKQANNHDGEYICFWGWERHCGDRTRFLSGLQPPIFHLSLQKTRGPELSLSKGSRHLPLPVAMSTEGYEGGVGGKLRTRQRPRAPATPYNQLMAAARGLRDSRIEDGAEAGRRSGWVSKLVDPASTLIAKGASRHLSTMFHTQLGPLPPAEFPEMYFQRHKRTRTCNDENNFLPYNYGNNHANKGETHSSTNTDSLVLPELLGGLTDNKYGSVTKEYEKLHAQYMQLMNYLYAQRSSLTTCPNPVSHSSAGSDARGASPRVDEEISCLRTSAHELNLDDNYGAIVALPLAEGTIEIDNSYEKNKERETSKSIIVIDSDEEDIGNTKLDISFSVESSYQPSVQYHQVVLTKAINIKSSERTQDKNVAENNGESDIGRLCVKLPKADESSIGTLPEPDLVRQDDSLSTANQSEDDCEASESDGLEDLWKERSLALEYSKNTASDGSADPIVMPEGPEDCEHDYLLKDDVGLVCRICGVIKKSITAIFDYQWRKGSQTTRIYTSGSRKPKDADGEIPGVRLSEDNLLAAELAVHPRHLQQMKPHQIEGFNFLLKNLVGDNPGGCILAHAPGSGKTFMLISFIQSFLANYPSAKPLIVLPKGILPTWKREFKNWEIETIPLYDFYTEKADNRSQQLDILKKWQANKSILFLGYKQFSRIVSYGKDDIETACQEMLLKVPGLLILDEGHTPRNEDTNILSTLAKVQTPRKVVLSGTLFQNHVKEVFNILNLVRCKFLKMESSRNIMRRILSRVHMSGGSRRHLKADLEASFCELVEETLQDDVDLKRRIRVIQDLREMTNDVLHYYKGDFLEELPGLVDFTVLLNLSSKQRSLLGHLGKYDKFKRSAVGSALYLHPCLKDYTDYASGDRSINEEIDDLLGSIDLNDGVKTKFFLNILSMADPAGEKMLIFSQYILPLRFLERLIVKVKDWQPGKEIFMISGDTNIEQRESAMKQFNNSPHAKILLGSIKACGEGISLIGASRVVILDVHLNPSVSRQAIGRAFRPGQTKKVFTYRLVAADSPEQKDHDTCFRKELISKMWFEWSEYSGHTEFELEKVDIEDCDDIFLANQHSVEDIRALYRR